MSEQVISKESKSILARLLATENLIVEHKNVSTASFNPKSRVLTLPIWKEMTGDIYDLLVGHEVSHALYSPSLDEIPSGISTSWVNVVEDARIEKLIKRKFPGLAGNFFRGYKELFDRNFFETKDRNLNTYSLIDRINLHFKNVPLVPFKDEEKQYVDMVSRCETFEDVIETVKALREYAEQQEQDFEDIEDFDFGQEGEGEESEEESESPEKNQSGDGEEQEDNSVSNKIEDSDEESEDSQSSESQQTSSSLGESETEEAWSRNQENLLDEKSRNYIYLNIPEVYLDEIIVDWKTYNECLTVEVEELKRRIAKNPYSYNTVENSTNRYLQFKKSTTKSVNYLVKEFEMRKSADEHRRASIAKTGVLDTNMIHTYKWNEDIFKKLTILPGAKNHGLLFFLDWSGSMDYCIKNTVKQLYNLIWFCNKVQIPFEVYAFSELEAYRNAFGVRNNTDQKIDDIAIHDGIRLHQLFTSEMKKPQLEDQMQKFWLLVNHHYNFSNWFALGGTPLNEAIICSRKIAERFLKKNKVQKLNFVFLTDGESNNLGRWCQPKSKYYNDKPINYCLAAYSSTGDKYIIRDNSRTYPVDKYDNFKQTETMLNWLSDSIDANIIGFRLTNDREANNYVTGRAGMLWESVGKQWRKNSSYSLNRIGGYDELYLIRNNNLLGADTKDIVVDTDATKAQIRKAFSTHMKSKSYNKVILNKFIGVIA